MLRTIPFRDSRAAPGRVHGSEGQESIRHHAVILSLAELETLQGFSNMAGYATEIQEHDSYDILPKLLYQIRPCCGSPEWTTIFPPGPCREWPK